MQRGAATVEFRGRACTAPGTYGTKALDTYQAAAAAKHVVLVQAGLFVVRCLAVEETVVPTRETLPATVAASSRSCCRHLLLTPQAAVVASCSHFSLELSQQRGAAEK